MLVLANVVPRGVEGAEDELERAISEAASLAIALVDAGYAVGLATADGGIAPDAGRDGLLRVHEHLALLPVRSVLPGTRVPVFDGYDPRHVERLSVVTASQRDAAIPVDADRSVLVEASARHQQGDAALGVAA